MLPETRKKILRWILYLFIFFASFLFFIYQTFPYDAIFQRYSLPWQKRAKIQLSVKELTPYRLSGVHIKGLEFQKPSKRGLIDLYVSEVTARLALLPLLTGRQVVNFDVKLRHSGRLYGKVIRKGSDIELDLQVEGVRLRHLGPKGRKGKPLLHTLLAPVYGKISGYAQLQLKIKRRGRRVSVDPTKAKGTIKLKMKGIIIGPGTIPDPRMGQLPLPKLFLGTLNLYAKMGKGRVNIKNVHIKGRDGEFRFKGNLKLKKRMNRSVMKGNLKFNVSKSFLDRRGKATVNMFKGVVKGFLQGKTKRKGFYSCNLYLPFKGRPRCKIR